MIKFRWVDVVIDDRLPYLNNKLLFCSNKSDPNEFWGKIRDIIYDIIHI
jgi:hypothetical protein